MEVTSLLGVCGFLGSCSFNLRFLAGFGEFTKKSCGNEENDGLEGEGALLLSGDMGGGGCKKSDGANGTVDNFCTICGERGPDDGEGVEMGGMFVFCFPSTFGETSNKLGCLGASFISKIFLAPKSNNGPARSFISLRVIVKIVEHCTTKNKLLLNLTTSLNKK